MKRLCCYESAFNCCHIILFSLVYRIWFALITRTAFVPDEYFQGPEVAFHVVYGIGIKTWEWMPNHKLRSYVSIMHYIAYYSNSFQLNSFSPSVGPRVVQAILGTLGDLYLFRVARLFNVNSWSPFVSWFFHTFSWSCSYCTSRTMINSTEANLGIITAWYVLRDIHFSPFTSKDTVSSECTETASMQRATFVRFVINNFTSSASKLDCFNNFKLDNLSCLTVFLVVLSVFIRPTATLLWAPVGAIVFIRTVHTTASNNINDFAFRKLLELVSTCVAAFIICVTIDSYFYGELTFSLWNFFTINVIQDYASLFGTKPMLWYYTSGLPIMLGFYYPLLLLSVLFIPVNNDTNCVLAWVFTYVCGLTLFSRHKEIRFLLPVLPFIHLYIGSSVCSLASGNFENIFALRSKNVSNQGMSLHQLSKTRLRLTLYCVVASLVHFVLAVFLARFHQFGTEPSFGSLSKILNKAYLANLAEVHNNANYSVDSSVANILTSPQPFVIHLLAPCHSFPGYSFIPVAAKPSFSSTSSITSASIPFEFLVPTCAESATFELDPYNFWKQKLRLRECVPDGLNMSFVNPGDYAVDATCAFQGESNENMNEEKSIWPLPHAVLTFDAYAGNMTSLLHVIKCVQVERLRHTYFRYDYDDPYVKEFVEVYLCSRT